MAIRSEDHRWYLLNGIVVFALNIVMDWKVLWAEEKLNMSISSNKMYWCQWAAICITTISFLLFVYDIKEFTDSSTSREESINTGHKTGLLISFLQNLFNAMIALIIFKYRDCSTLKLAEAPCPCTPTTDKVDDVVSTFTILWSSSTWEPMLAILKSSFVSCVAIGFRLRSMRKLSYELDCQDFECCDNCCGVLLMLFYTILFIMNCFVFICVVKFGLEFYYESIETC